MCLSRVISILLKSALVAIPIFFAISFLTVLPHLNSPLNRTETLSNLDIGFPLAYYHEFMVDCPTANSGWNVKNLILDGVIVWLGTFIIFLAVRNVKFPS